jgi:hypothetical protein
MVLARARLRYADCVGRRGGRVRSAGPNGRQLMNVAIPASGVDDA